MPKQKQKPLKWLPRARRQLLQIQNYYIDNVGERIADEAIDAIYYQTEKIAERPMPYRKSEKAHMHECTMSRFPFVIFYRITNTHITIQKIIHQRAKR